MSVCFIAHKGYCSKYYENTESAFLGAVRHGSGGIETDIRVTRDGIPVTHHNRSVVFSDGSELNIENSTYEQLIQKPMRNSLDGSEVYLCTYRRYLEICRDGHMICFIELKGNFSDEAIQIVGSMARDVYDLRMCQLQSFEYDNLLRMRKAFPEMKVMLTCDRHDALVDRALADGIDIDMQYKNIEDRTILMFHEQGLKVGLWTVNTREGLGFCLSKHVDFIESDVFNNAEGN